jgi:hypothetical protein
LSSVGLATFPGDDYYSQTVTRALHIIDRDTPADMLMQLSALVGEDDAIVSAGPAGRFDLLGRAQFVHQPLGSAVLCGFKLAGLIDAEVVHAWSARAQRVGQVVARINGRILVRSVPAVPPSGKPLRRLLRSLSHPELLITVPSQAGRMVAL